MMKKCEGKDRNMNDCRCNALIEINSRFCKNHQYMNNYTAEQLQDLKICTGCKKAYFLETNKICDKCIDRSKENRVKKKDSYVKCDVEKCQSKKSDQNKYCLKHQIYVWVDEVNEKGHTPCVQFIRGCRNTIESGTKYKTCETCRQKEREKDKKLRETAKQENQISTDPNMKCCTTCRKTFPKDYFVGEKTQETATCKHCRESDKLQNTRRDKEHRRKQGRIYDAKESRKKKKLDWKLANWEKVVQAWRSYRTRQRSKNEQEYLQKNAEYAKQWRTNNPEAVTKQYERNKMSLQFQYNIYIQSAKHRNIEFELSIEEYKSTVECPCYYCGIINEKRGFHGMDRKDNTLSYKLENVVACCPMCNYMKGSLHHDIFVRRVEHIMSHQNIIEGEQYPECFINIKHVKYIYYIAGAKFRNLEFSIDEGTFENIIRQPCYICGKQSDHYHTNGIDRYDSKYGYTIENCKSCCRECNFMKSYFEFSTFIEKIQKIRQRHYNTRTSHQTYGIFKCQARKLLP